MDVLARLMASGGDILGLEDGVSAAQAGIGVMEANADERDEGGVGVTKVERRSGLVRVSDVFQEVWWRRIRWHGGMD